MTIKDDVLRRPQFSDDEATDALYAIAEKLKEIDKLFGESWERFPSEVKELIEKADPKNEMDPDHWSKQFIKVAGAVEEEAAQRYKAEQIANSESSPSVNADHDSPQI